MDRVKKMDEGDAETRPASAPLLAADTVFAVPVVSDPAAVEELEEVEEEVTAGSTTELDGRTVAAEKGCVPIDPDPMTIICTFHQQCVSTPTCRLTWPCEGIPSTTRKIIAGPGWKMLAFGGICETCNVTRPVSDAFVYEVESSR